MSMSEPSDQTFSQTGHQRGRAYETNTKEYFALYPVNYVKKIARHSGYAVIRGNTSSRYLVTPYMSFSLCGA